MAITYFERPLNHEVYSLESGLAIVQNGDTASVAITSGQYIFLKNHSTLPNGGYHATANIAVGTTISSSNVVADANGIANALNEAVSTVNGNLANKANITGTPEIVSNSNGVAYKFPNGLMICTKQADFNCAITTAWGALYESSKQSLGNFAQQFTSIPDVSLQSVIKDGSYNNCFVEGLTSRGVNFIGETWLLRPVSTATAKYCLSVIAVGRWK